MSAEPGTPCKVSYDLYGEDPPAEGDILVTLAGSCYEVMEVRPSPTLDRVYLECTRLGKDAAEYGQPGTHLLIWNAR